MAAFTCSTFSTKEGYAKRYAYATKFEKGKIGNNRDLG